MIDARDVAGRSLEEQRWEYARRRGIAMPLAGLIAWAIVGIGGLVLPKIVEVWLLFGATGSIVYLGLIISRWTGENFLDRNRPLNAFDALFFHAIARTLLVTATWYLLPAERFVAIPFVIVGLYVVTIIVLERRWRPNSALRH